jgi:hypothetical protein
MRWLERAFAEGALCVKNESNHEKAAEVEGTDSQVIAEKSIGANLGHPTFLLPPKSCTSAEKQLANRG